jgi:hypothetical protein
MREPFPPRRREKQKVKSQRASLPRKDPRSPFYQTRGACYINVIGQVRRESVCAYPTGVPGGKPSRHAAGPAALGPCPPHDDLRAFPCEGPRQ